MSDIKMPTVGRMVHYFPTYYTHAFGTAEKLPAIVQNDDMCPDLHIFQPNEDKPVLFLRSIPHKSQSQDDNRMGYWDWPEIK